jgi:hypothetical protein
MKRLFLALVALLFAIPALADKRVTTFGGNVVRLSTEVCTAAPVLALIPKKYHNVVRDATATLNGKQWHACWFVDGEDAHMLYEDGDQGLIPLALFTKEKDA